MRRTTAAPRAEDDAELLLARRQRAAGERDHDGVVAGQDDVHADDLHQRGPELRHEQEIHRPLLPFLSFAAPVPARTPGASAPGPAFSRAAFPAATDVGTLARGREILVQGPRLGRRPAPHGQRHDADDPNIRSQRKRQHIPDFDRMVRLGRRPAPRRGRGRRGSAFAASVRDLKKRAHHNHLSTRCSSASASISGPNQPPQLGERRMRAGRRAARRRRLPRPRARPAANDRSPFSSEAA